LEEAPQFVIEVTVNGTKYKRILDSGADCSMTRIDNINKKGEHKLFKWKGELLCTIHDAFWVLGARKEIATLQDTLIGANYCVVAEKFVRAACPLLDYPEWVERGTGIDHGDYVTCLPHLVCLSLVLNL
jgi:hypothetical protein